MRHLSRHMLIRSPPGALSQRRPDLQQGSDAVRCVRGESSRSNAGVNENLCLLRSLEPSNYSNASLAGQEALWQPGPRRGVGRGRPKPVVGTEVGTAVSSDEQIIAATGI